MKTVLTIFVFLTLTIQARAENCISATGNTPFARAIASGLCDAGFGISIKGAQRAGEFVLLASRSQENVAYLLPWSEALHAYYRQSDVTDREFCERHQLELGTDFFPSCATPDRDVDNVKSRAAFDKKADNILGIILDEAPKSVRSAKLCVVIHRIGELSGQVGCRVLATKRR